MLMAIAACGYWFTTLKPPVDASDRVKLPTPVAEPPAGLRGLIVREGHFHDVARTGAGTATIYRNPDGRTILQFAEFETAPGDELQVCLVAAKDAFDSQTVKRAGCVRVAPLQAIMGDQSYELPASIDLSRYRAVTILSRRTGVNFATAPLE
jgi:hypothetical protein